VARAFWKDETRPASTTGAGPDRNSRIGRIRLFSQVTFSVDRELTDEIGNPLFRFRFLAEACVGRRTHEKAAASDGCGQHEQSFEKIDLSAPFFELKPSDAAAIFIAFIVSKCAVAMDRFIHNENIRRYRKLLEEETDEEKRNTIRRLLAEEEAKKIPPSPKRHDEKSKRP
jgi:hypothetical protein